VRESEDEDSKYFVSVDVLLVLRDKERVCYGIWRDGGCTMAHNWRDDPNAWEVGVLTEETEY